MPPAPQAPPAPPAHGPGSGIDLLRKPQRKIHKVTPSSPDSEGSISLETKCDNVNFHWLYVNRAFNFVLGSVLIKFIFSASQRQFWDGWTTVSMFLRGDGRFTRKEVDIQAGESICVVVLVSLFWTPVRRCQD